SVSPQTFPPPLRSTPLPYASLFRSQPPHQQQSAEALLGQVCGVLRTLCSSCNCPPRNRNRDGPITVVLVPRLHMWLRSYFHTHIIIPHFSPVRKMFSDRPRDLVIHRQGVTAPHRMYEGKN